MTATPSGYRLPAMATRLFQALALLGGGMFLAGVFLAAQQTWGNLLLVSYYLLGLGLGAAVLLALLHVTGATWAFALRRVPEALTALLPLGALGLGLVLLVRPSLYPWSRPEAGGLSLSPLQQVWLTRPFFLVRSLVYLALWIVLARALVRATRGQEQTDTAASATKAVRLSALFLVVFAVTCWLASTDWIMSLEPRWSSTIFGVYHFAGIFLSALAAVLLVVIGLSWQGPFRNVLTRQHLYDLGTLLFGFSSFWMYLWFCQYLLIWYVNNPEETVYYWRRQEAGWQVLFLLNVVLSWGVPFVVLLFRPAKENRGVLAAMAVSILAGRWLDLDLMILRPLTEAPLPSVWGVGLFLGGLGLVGLLVGRALGQPPLIPVKQPLPAEGLSSVSPGRIIESVGK
jgi:hypothetical protein